jgi:hypothetical protein
MKTSDSENEKAAPPLWQYVPIADYHLPAAPVTESVKERLAVFRRLFLNREPEQESPFKASDNLRALPDWQCERVAPAAEWHASADALTLELQAWLEQEKPGKPVIVLVGPPHGGHAETLSAWAEQQGWPTISPPSAEQILADDDTWLSGQSSTDSPWVFPALEHAYLRHAEGLSLIRRFLDRVCSGDLGRGIIGCDSWAWAFLRHVWRGRLPVTLALQACDKARLSDHFQQLADPSGDRQIRFRQSDNGRYVLDPPKADPEAGETTSFLQLLAAHSRGIPGVARAVWRASLQTEPDEKLAGEPPDAGARQMTGQTVWVLPWSQLSFPELPSGAGRDEAFVLHTLLLHNGLALEPMQWLLPLSPSQVMETLLRLEDSGLAVQADTVWQVAPRGYPAARQFLQGNGYLVDQF